MFHLSVQTTTARIIATSPETSTSSATSSPEVPPNTSPPTSPTISHEASSNTPPAITQTVYSERSPEISLTMTLISTSEATSTKPSAPTRATFSETLPISSSTTPPEISLETPTDVTPACPHPGNIEHGIAQPDYPHRDFLLGEKVVYICDETFVHRGAKEIFCLGNSTWSDKLPACVPLRTSDKGNKIKRKKRLTENSECL